MLLNRKELDKHDEAIVNKVADVIHHTNSKREMAKAMTYCALWGGSDPLGIRCYNLYSEAVNRIQKLGLSIAHVENYLPFCWTVDTPKRGNA